METIDLEKRDNSTDESSLETFTKSLELSGIKPQFKRQLPDGSLIDTDPNYLELLHSKSRLTNTAHAIKDAPDELKTEWAIAMKDFANNLFKDGQYSQALEKYLECLAASQFGSESVEMRNNIDILVVPVLCNMAACCIQLREFSKSAKFCEEALKLRPNHMKANMRLAKTLIHQGEYKQALDRLNSITLISKNNVSDSSDDLLSTAESSQLNDLIFVAKRGIDREQKAVNKQKAALQKAFSKSNPNLADNKIIIEKGTFNTTTNRSFDTSKNNFLQMLLARILSLISFIMNWFKIKNA